MVQKIKLGTVIKQRRQKNPGGDLPVCGITREGFIPPKQLDADTSIYNCFYLNDFVFNPARMELNSIVFNNVYEKAICSSLYEMFYVCREDIILPEYLALVVKTDWFTRYCDYLGNGSAREYCRFANISEMTISVPSIEEQHKIIKDFNKLNDRLKLNQDIIDNLYKLAMQIYLESIQDKSKTCMKFISEICQFSNGYSYSSDELLDSNIGMLTIRNFERYGGFKVEGFKSIIPERKVKKLKTYDVVIACTDLTQDADIIGNTEMVLSKGNYDELIASMDIVTILPKEDSQFLILQALKKSLTKSIVKGYVSGTTVLHLDKKIFDEVQITIPSESQERIILSQKLEKIYEYISLLINENMQLEKSKEIKFRCLN